MVLEARIGERLGVTAAGTALRLAAALDDAGLPITTSLDPQQLVTRTYGDKKKVSGRVEYALPSTLGRFEKWTTPVDDLDVLAVLRESAR
jgi:3-dehydroquinate synthase